MSSSFHNQPAYTSAPNEPTVSSPLPSSEYNGSSMNLRPIYPSISNPWIPLDPMFAWLYPSVVYDPGFWNWVAGNYPLGGLGPALTNCGPVGSPLLAPWMMNPGQVGQPPMVPTSPESVLSPSTPVEAGPATVAPDVTAVEEQETGNDQQADNQNSSQPFTLKLKCKWGGCTYTGAFAAKSSLRRHVNATHLSPNLFKCPKPQCTKKAFGRKDKYDEHIRSTEHDRVQE